MATQPCYPDKAPKVDEVLDALSHHLRREILDYFENHADGRAVTLDELVAFIERRVPRETVESLRMKLYHTHLPQLADYGWLDFDSRSEAIHYRSHDHADQWLGEVHAVFTA